MKWLLLGGLAVVACAVVVQTGCTLTAPAEMPSAPEVRDLPLVTVAPDSVRPGTPLVVLLSGDGGWASHVQRMAEYFRARGIPVVGWNSLRYYWRRRTPEEAAADLARVMDHYGRRWHTGPVIVLGYSFGADVAPFLVRRLPAELRERVAEVAVVGYSGRGNFLFRIPMWWGRVYGQALPADPELRALADSGKAVLCVNGRRETQKGCTGVRDPRVATALLPTGHRFSGCENEVARLVMERYAAR